MNFYFLSAKVSLTLMLTQGDGTFKPSTVMAYNYYILAEESFITDIVASTKNLFNLIYDEHYDAFKLREPNDPNYIAVVDVEPKYLKPEEYADKPWLTDKKPSWENSNCIVVQNNSYQKVQPDSMAGMLGMA